MDQTCKNKIVNFIFTLGIMSIFMRKKHREISFIMKTKMTGYLKLE